MKKILLSLIYGIIVLSSCKQEEQGVVVNEAPQDIVAVSKMDDEASKLNKFYEYILSGRHQEALALVNSLDLGTDFSVREKTYKGLLDEFSLERQFYEDSKFNDVDYFYWLQNLLFKREVEKLKADLKEGEDPIKALYELVNKRISKTGEGPDRAAFPLQIWQRGFGVCDRQSWVMCELAYQLGADVYIIYFIEEDTGISKHTICQITYKGRNYLVDPLYQKFMPDFHWNDLTEDKATEIWHDHVYLADDIKNAEILLPSMPQDFCVRQQMLANKLKPLISRDVLFRFGEDPKERSKRWLYKKGQDYFYWDYPHRLMTGMVAYRQRYGAKEAK
jgi:hypothetical protein